VSYSVGLSLLLGGGFAWIFPYVTKQVVGYVRSSMGPWSVATLAFIVASLVVVVLLLLGSMQGGKWPTDQSPLPSNLHGETPITLERYTATIEPKGAYDLARFAVRESVTIRFGGDEPPLILTSTHEETPNDERDGLLLREASFHPAESRDFTSLGTDLRYGIGITDAEQVILTARDPSGARLKRWWSGRVCHDGCPASEIKLLHFPEGSFSEADNKNNLEIEHYRDIEEVTWSPDNLGRTIAFSYVPAPYYRLPFIQILLRPFESLTSLSTSTIFLLGAAIVAFGKLVDFIQQVITMTGWWQRYLKPRLIGATRRNAEEQEPTREQEASKGKEQMEPDGHGPDNTVRQTQEDEEQRKPESNRK
jgi:hypothetical protein